jgi:hypothetical protein
MALKKNGMCGSKSRERCAGAETARIMLALDRKEMRRRMTDTV